MNFHRINAFRGPFKGFRKIRDLQDSKSECDEIPKVKGVYLIVRETTDPPEFLKKSTAGHFKGKDPTVPVKELRAKWVEGTEILYIGKAGGKGQKTTLNERVSRLINFGKGKPVSHWGGRYIWQLADSKNLLVRWKEMPTENPIEEERNLLMDFRKQCNDRLPFANLPPGRRSEKRKGQHKDRAPDTQVEPPIRGTKAMVPRPPKGTSGQFLGKQRLVTGERPSTLPDLLAMVKRGEISENEAPKIWDEMLQSALRKKISELAPELCPQDSEYRKKILGHIPGLGFIMHKAVCEKDRPKGGESGGKRNTS